MGLRATQSRRLTALLLPYTCSFAYVATKASQHERAALLTR
jgi:hypothetical protein